MEIQSSCLRYMVLKNLLRIPKSSENLILANDWFLIRIAILSHLVICMLSNMKLFLLSLISIRQCRHSGKRILVRYVSYIMMLSNIIGR